MNSSMQESLAPTMSAAGQSSILAKLANSLGVIGKGLDSLQPLLALGLRWYVSWQFLKSGWLKVTDWTQTLDLFQTEYHVPVLPPYLAAVVGSFGELFFPMLLILGLGGRIAPLGLFAVNAMAVISYARPAI